MADYFEKRIVEKVETQLKEYFEIEKKDIITFNVKHAMRLDKDRIDKLVERISKRKISQKVLRNMFAQAN